MTATWNKNDAYKRAQEILGASYKTIDAAWLSGAPDPTLPVPVAPPKIIIPSPVIPMKALADSININFAGLSWMTQGTGISMSDDGKSVSFEAKAGVRASFDPDRKIRSELGSNKFYIKDEAIRLSGIINIDPLTDMGNANWWTLFQIHAASPIQADGTQIDAAPPFSISAVPGSGGKLIQVGIQTSKGVPPLRNAFAPLQIVGTFPITFGVDHKLSILASDGHGGPGMFNVTIDDKVINYSGNTGYEFVDLMGLWKDKVQASTSNIKLGVYAGNTDKNAPPSNGVFKYKFTSI